MNDLVIYGAGGAGRENYQIVQEINTFRFLGFIDDSSREDTCMVVGRGFAKILHGNPRVLITNWLRDRPNSCLSINISPGNPYVKEKMLNNIPEDLRILFPTLINPNVDQLYYSEIGGGCVILSKSVFTVNVKIGNFVRIHVSCNITHEVEIGDFSTVSPGSTLCGGVKVGKRCQIGAGTTVLPKVKIADDVIVGAGSVVTKDVDSGIVVVGNPAKYMRRNHEIGGREE